MLPLCRNTHREKKMSKMENHSHSLCLQKFLRHYNNPSQLLVPLQLTIVCPQQQVDFLWVLPATCVCTYLNFFACIHASSCYWVIFDSIGRTRAFHCNIQWKTSCKFKSARSFCLHLITSFNRIYSSYKYSRSS